MAEFHCTVYWEDTDAGGVVYYANYLKFAERARTEALRRAGIEQTRLQAEHGLAFVVRRAEVDFHRPAKLDDHLTIFTQVEDNQHASIVLAQEIRRTDTLLCKVKVRLALIGPGFKPVRMPPFLRDALLRAYTPT